MNILEFIETMKKVQEYLETFIDEENDTKINFDNFVKIIEEKKIREDSNELKSFFYLLINISNNHKRCPDFFLKIDQIIKFLSADIKKYYSNQEIFEIFSSNKRVLLYLIREGLLNVDHQIAEMMKSDTYKESQYIQYFSPEITRVLGSNIQDENSKKKIDFYCLFFCNYQKNKSNKKSDTIKEKPNKPVEIESPIFNEEDFERNRNIGENESHICSLIRNDSIDEFIVYINEENISFNSTICDSIYETNSFLIGKNTKLIEYAAFFGSIQIFKYLQLNNADINDSLWNFIIHGRNPEIIDLYNNIFDMKDDYKNIFEESIKCHHNDISSFILSNFIENNKEEAFDFIQSSLHYYNFEFINIDDINNCSMCYLCKYNQFILLKLLLENKNIDEKTFVETYIDNETNKEVETTALIIAVEHKNIDIIKLLLQLDKFDINYTKKIKDDNKIYAEKTALFIAVEQEDVEIVKLLLSNEKCNANFLNYNDYKLINNTALHIAIEKENYEIINLLLNYKNIDVNIRDFHNLKYTTEEEKTALYYAIEKENSKIIKLLLECPNIDVNFTSVFGSIDDDGDIANVYELLPLNLAIWLENIEIIKLLLSNSKIDINKPIILKYLSRNESITKVQTPLIQAMETNNMEIIKLLLSYDKLDLNIVNTFIDYSLFFEKQELIIGNNTHVDYNLLSEKATAFHVAMKIHDLELARIFFNNKKIDINARYQSSGSFYIKGTYDTFRYILKEETALNMAVEEENVEIVKQILSTYKNLVNVNLPNTIKICEPKFSSILRFNFVLEDNLKFNNFNDEEKSPLFIAVEKGNIEIVKLLLECEEIDVNLANKTYKWYYKIHDDWEKTTVLNKAVECGNIEILKLLLQCEKIDVNFKNLKDKEKVRTALHTAVEKENLEVIQLLLNHKNIDVNMCDGCGKKPLQYTRNKQIIELFNNK